MVHIKHWFNLREAPLKCGVQFDKIGQIGLKPALLETPVLDHFH